MTWIRLLSDHFFRQPHINDCGLVPAYRYLPIKVLQCKMQKSFNDVPLIGCKCVFIIHTGKRNFRFFFVFNSACLNIICPEDLQQLFSTTGLGHRLNLISLCDQQNRQNSSVGPRGLLEMKRINTCLYIQSLVEISETLINMYQYIQFVLRGAAGGQNTYFSEIY